jgi:hypothetical protein
MDVARKPNPGALIDLTQRVRGCERGCAGAASSSPKVAALMRRGRPAVSSFPTSSRTSKPIEPLMMLPRRKESPVNLRHARVIGNSSRSKNYVRAISLAPVPIFIPLCEEDLSTRIQDHQEPRCQQRLHVRQKRGFLEGALSATTSFSLPDWFIVL